MEPKSRTDRRITTRSISPKEEELQRSQEKVPIHDGNVPNLAKRTGAPLLPIAGKKDQKYPSLTSANLTQSNTININKILSNEKTLNKEKAWKQSSPRSQTVDIGLQKRPLKLAPLNLPEEVKEAQLQKIMAVKDEVLLVKRNSSQARKTMEPSGYQTTERGPLAGLPEKNLSAFRATNIVLKDTRSPTFITNLKEKKSGHLIDKIKNGQLQEDAPDDKSNDGLNVLTKEGFIHAKGYNTYPHVGRPEQIDRLVIEHRDPTDDIKHKREKKKKNQATLMTPTLNININ